MHITITGNLGSGKSTICKILNEKYDFDTYSTGKVQRELAEKHNMTTLEFNQLMCSDPKYDNMIDNETARISRENRDKNIIFDSRLAWNFVEKSFKVFLSVDIEISAKRVMSDKDRGTTENYTSLEEAKEKLIKRAETEHLRYKELYNLDYSKFSNYNLIIDSSYNTPEKIAEIILNEANLYEQNPSYHTKYLISPKRLIGNEDINAGKVDELKDLIDKNIEIYENKLIQIQEKNNVFVVTEGLDLVKAAFISGIDYIQVIA